MHQLISYAILYILLSAFSNGSYADPGIRWSFIVEGMPKIEGSVIINMGMGSHTRYTAASPDATVNLSMPGARLMIKYKEPKVTCVNSRNTAVKVDGNQTVFSGTVRCFTQASTKPNDQDDTAIEGWFKLDK